MSDMYQPELGNESLDLRATAVPGDEVVPNGRIGRCMEGVPKRH